MTEGFNKGSGLIGKWITNKNTLEYLGIWEKVNNPGFNYPEFGVIEQEAEYEPSRSKAEEEKETLKLLLLKLSNFSFANDSILKFDSFKK